MRAAMKPISTVPRALDTIDVHDRRAGQGDQPAQRRHRGPRRRRRRRGDGGAGARRRRRWRSSAATRAEETARNPQGYLSTLVDQVNPLRPSLIGPPGSGKTTVGRRLAERLGVAFRDTDADVEAAAGKPIGEIFIDDGEERFRALERAAVATALAEHEGVLALGGGADPRRRRPRPTLAGQPVVYLEVGLSEAVKRVGLGLGAAAARAQPAQPVPQADGGAAARLRAARHGHGRHRRPRARRHRRRDRQREPA